MYYGDYCSGSNPCETSNKGVLNTTSGQFTIYQTQISDSDYYYYRFFSPGVPDTGAKYEIYLDVYDKSR